MGTPDHLFRFLLKVATDVPTMTRLSSGNPTLVDAAFEGAELSENQKDAIRNGSEADVRAELSLSAGFVFNQSGFSVFNQSGDSAEANASAGTATGGKKARKASKAAKSKKTSKAVRKGTGAARKSAKRVGKAIRAAKASKVAKASKASTKAVKKSKGRKK